MIAFEKYLLSQGYYRIRRNHYNVNYYDVITDNQAPSFVSTMLNLQNIFLDKNEPVLNLIKDNKISKKEMEEQNITFINPIFVGLHEAHKPPTLIYPRPNCQVTRIVNGENVIFFENGYTYPSKIDGKWVSGEWTKSSIDDTMNVVLQHIKNEEILKAILDKEIILKVDLTCSND